MNDTSKRMRMSDMAFETKADRVKRYEALEAAVKIRAVMDAVKSDWETGEDLASALGRTLPSQLVEPFQFPVTGDVYYQYTARPYGDTVIFVKTVAAAERVMSHFNKGDFSGTTPDYVAGFCSGNRVGPILVAVLSGGSATLIHEVTHAAMKILNRQAIKSIAGSAEEPLAYLIEDLFAAFSPYL